MFLGPTLYLKCTNDTCSHLFESTSILSGNTYGSTVYSDSKMISPMLPDLPFYSKCPNCGTFARRNEFIEIEEEDYSIESDQNVSCLTNLTIEEYDELLHNTEFIKDKEEILNIRLLLMFAFNDRTRFGQRLIKNEKERSIRENNLLYLFDALDSSNDVKKLIKTEILRNLGRFDEAIEILESIINEEINWAIELIKTECKRKNTLTFELILPN